MMLPLQDLRFACEKYVPLLCLLEAKQKLRSREFHVRGNMFQTQVRCIRSLSRCQQAHNTHVGLGLFGLFVCLFELLVHSESFACLCQKKLIM